MSDSKNRPSPAKRIPDHLLTAGGRLSASPELLEAYDHHRHTTSGSPSSDAVNRSLFESTADWSSLEPNNGDPISCIDGPEVHRYASKDYALPARKPELYAFFENPLTKTVEKLSKLTDLVVSDRRSGPSRYRSYGFNSFVGPYDGPTRVGPGHSLDMHGEEPHLIGIPPPSLPHIESARQVQRNPPLTQEQFELKGGFNMTKRQMLNEIFYSVRLLCTQFARNAIMFKLFSFGLIERESKTSN
jgi:hypothetical protein